MELARPVVAMATAVAPPLEMAPGRLAVAGAGDVGFASADEEVTAKGSDSGLGPGVIGRWREAEPSGGMRRGDA